MGETICSYKFDDEDYFKMVQNHLSNEFGDGSYGYNGWKTNSFNVIDLLSNISNLDKGRELCEENQGRRN